MNGTQEVGMVFLSSPSIHLNKTLLVYNYIILYILHIVNFILCYQPSIDV